MTTKQECASTHSKDGRQISQGYTTPAELDTEQCHRFCPERVIPIIFIPGILGSKLRIKGDGDGPGRHTTLIEKYNRKKGDRIAWNPDDTGKTLGFGQKGPIGMSPAERQLTLDQNTTEVDTFDFGTAINPSTLPDENDYIKRNSVVVDSNSPYLKPHKEEYRLWNGKKQIEYSAARKACQRGWGELMFNSYGVMLNRAELMLNRMFDWEGCVGKLNPEWQKIIGENGADPAKLGAVTPGLPKLTENDLKELGEKKCWFPVHAVGVNWLQSVGDSCMQVKKRIEKIMADYNSKKIRCEKVIIVTHSHGGLVSRALCHPELGNFQDKVLGVVYGEQPAIGAAAAYYRMLGGWESSGGLKNSIAEWALGDEGPEVTVMLGNGPGGMQLLPFKEYGNHWLEVVDTNGRVLRRLPENGDPYEEIYVKSSKDAWWGLLREEWLNPAEKQERDAGLEETRRMIRKKVKPVHEAIGKYYHPLSYAHYGDDPERKSIAKAKWLLKEADYEVAVQRQDMKYTENFLANQPVLPKEKLDALPILTDKGDKRIILRDTTVTEETPVRRMIVPLVKGTKKGDASFLVALLQNPADPGDQTVPTYSAVHQQNSTSPKFEGVFVLKGYEHQDSYNQRSVQDATLYGIVQIAKKMKW